MTALLPTVLLLLTSLPLILAIPAPQPTTTYPKLDLRPRQSLVNTYPSIPVYTSPPLSGGSETIIFAGHTFTIPAIGTGMLTLTLGRDAPVATAAARLENRQEELEGRQELGAPGNASSDGDGQVLTFTDGGGEVRTLTVEGGGLSFTMGPP